MTVEQAIAAIHRLIKAEVAVMKAIDNGGRGLKTAESDEAVAVTALFNALTGQLITDEQIKAMVEL